MSAFKMLTILLLCIKELLRNKQTYLELSKFVLKIGRFALWTFSLVIFWVVLVNFMAIPLWFLFKVYAGFYYKVDFSNIFIQLILLVGFVLAYIDLNYENNRR